METQNFPYCFDKKILKSVNKKLVMFSLKKGTIFCFLRKSTHSCKKHPLQQLGFFVNLCPVTESSKGHPTFLCCCRPGDFSHFPTLVNRIPISNGNFACDALFTAPAFPFCWFV